MEKAKDVDVPIVLHTESTTPESCKEFVEMGKKAGFLSKLLITLWKIMCMVMRHI